MNRFITTIFILICFVTEGVAQTCDLAQVATKIQAYSETPFSARTWRVLQGLGDPGIEAAFGAESDYESVSEWKDQVTQLAPDLTDLQNAGYNCRLGYAVETLKARVQQFGANHPYVRQWLLNQNYVLMACRGEPDPTYAQNLPPLTGEVSADVAQVQSHDRAYQEAALAFYTNPTLALPKFKAIGQSTSPHKAAARYNVANLLANAKDLNGARAEAQAILQDASLKSVHKITEDLVGYIANLSDTAADWTALIDSTIARIVTPLDQLKSDPVKQKAYAQALFDIEFAGVRHKHGDWWLEGKLPENPTISKAIVDASRKYPMAAWMMAGQTLDGHFSQATPAVIGQKWLAQNKDYVARVLALHPNGVGGPARDILLASQAGDADGVALWTTTSAAMDKAFKSCGEAPETAAAGFLFKHAMRVSANAGRYGEIYQRLQNLPNKSGRFYISKINDVGQHLLATGNVAEGKVWIETLLTPEFYASASADESKWAYDYSNRIATWFSQDEAQWKSAVAKLPSALESPILNLLPGKTLQDLVSSGLLKPNESSLAQRVIWLRAHLKGRKWARSLSALGPANAEVAQAFAGVKQEFPKLKEADQVLLTLLRQPRVGLLLFQPESISGDDLASNSFNAIDNYDPNDNNWWCPLQPDRHLGAVRAAVDSLTGLDRVSGDWVDADVKSKLDPVLLAKVVAGRESMLAQHPMMRAIDWAEVDALAKVPSGPKYLSERALRLAGLADPSDQAAAEALALAVRSTRYGCRWNGGHKAYSKPAQELLKAKFATSPWSAKTPYWFDCMDSEWDKDFKRVQTCKVKQWPAQMRP